MSDFKFFGVTFLITFMLCILYGIIMSQYGITYSLEYYSIHQFPNLHNFYSELNNHPTSIKILLSGTTQYLLPSLLVAILAGYFSFRNNHLPGIFKLITGSILAGLIVALLCNLWILNGLHTKMSIISPKGFDKWVIPKNVNDYTNYMFVKSLYHFSYIGLLTGTIAAFSNYYKGYRMLKK